MSYMNRPHSDALKQALKDHGMDTRRPSQLSDAFRLGFWAAERSLADAQAEIARLRGALESARSYGSDSWATWLISEVDDALEQAK